MNITQTAVTIEFNSSASRRYHIEICDALGIAPDYWRDSGMGLITPDPGAMTTRVVPLPREVRQFLRITPSKPLQ